MFDAFLCGVEFSFQLGLVAILQDFLEAGAGSEAQMNQVAALDEGTGLAIADFQGFGSFHKPGTFGKILGKGRAARRIGLGYPDQAVDPPRPERKPANGGVRGTRMEKLPRAEMFPDQRDHLLDDAVFRANPGQELTGGFFSLAVVGGGSDPSLLFDGGAVEPRPP